MSSSSLSEIVQSLGAKRYGADWLALCPAHADRGPSLAIREGTNGGVLVHCHAGCSQERVIGALRSLGLWNGNGFSEFRSSWGGSAKKESAGPVVAEYIYRDEQGCVLYQITRHIPKSFRASRPDGMGGWQPGITGIQRVPYHLPDVIANEIVFIVEGEKDCDTLGTYGFVATTNVFGAGKWDSALDLYFADKTVVLIPDGDKAGKDHMGQVEGHLLPFAKIVCSLELDPEVKDITEWFETGHSEVELCAAVEAALEGS